MQRCRQRRSRRTPDLSRHPQLLPHAAASFLHLVFAEGSVLLFPRRDRRQSSVPLQCRSGGGAGGRRKDSAANFRV
jgi:hypothetical protein